MERTRRHEKMARDIYSSAIRRARMMYPGGSKTLIEQVAHSLLSSACEIAFAGACYPMTSRQARPRRKAVPPPIPGSDEEITKPYDMPVAEELRKKTITG